jgi:hypothetical protein
VNNIIITFRNKNYTKVDKLIKSLRKHYNVSGGDSAQWFLRMKILRNLPLEHIWLGQKVSRELATWHCSDLAATLWRTYSG